MDSGPVMDREQSEMVDRLRNKYQAMASSRDGAAASAQDHGFDSYSLELAQKRVDEEFKAMPSTYTPQQSASSTSVRHGQLDVAMCHACKGAGVETVHYNFRAMTRDCDTCSGEGVVRSGPSKPAPAAPAGEEAEGGSLEEDVPALETVTPEMERAEQRESAAAPPPAVAEVRADRAKLVVRKAKLEAAIAGMAARANKYEGELAEARGELAREGDAARKRLLEDLIAQLSAQVEELHSGRGTRLAKLSSVKAALGGAAA